MTSVLSDTTPRGMSMGEETLKVPSPFARVRASSPPGKLTTTVASGEVLPETVTIPFLELVSMFVIALAGTNSSR